MPTGRSSVLRLEDVAQIIKSQPQAIILASLFNLGSGVHPQNARALVAVP
jgi:hypothetical protein